jgi:hypothetical protein
MEVELMACLQLERAAHLREVSWTSLARDLARVFHEHIPTLRQVVIDQEGGFAAVQWTTVLGRIVKRGIRVRKCRSNSAWPCAARFFGANPKRNSVSGVSSVCSPRLVVTANPFSTTGLPSGTTGVMPVTAGRSVEMGAEASSLQIANSELEARISAAMRVDFEFHSGGYDAYWTRMTEITKKLE